MLVVAKLATMRLTIMFECYQRARQFAMSGMGALLGTPVLSAFVPVPGTSRHQTRRPCGNEQSLPGACRADSADARSRFDGPFTGAGADDPSSHALPAAGLHPLYEEDVDVDVGVAQLFQRG